MSSPGKIPRSRTLAALLAIVAVVVLCTAAIGGRALYREFAGHSSNNGSSQCSKPVSQRHGGWTCPGN
jgi:hypothetical protein